LRLHRLNVVREYVSLGMHISNIMQCVSPAYGLRSVPWSITGWWKKSHNLLQRWCYSDAASWTQN